MAETVKNAKSASAKPKKTAAKKKTASAAASDPVTQNQHAEPQERSSERENGHKRNVSREEIARLAHQFWQERGHKHGHHIEDWVRAENELSGRAS